MGKRIICNLVTVDGTDYSLANEVNGSVDPPFYVVNISFHRDGIIGVFKDNHSENEAHYRIELERKQIDPERIEHITVLIPKSRLASLIFTEIQEEPTEVVKPQKARQ